MVKHSVFFIINGMQNCFRLGSKTGTSNIQTLTHTYISQQQQQQQKKSIEIKLIGISLGFKFTS